MMIKIAFIRAFLISLFVFTHFALVKPIFSQTIKLDQNLKPYVTTQAIGGNLNSIGSDTLNNLMTLWAESFRKLYPNVVIQIEGKGSATAPPALMESIAQLGPMSREMKKEEINEIQKKLGYAPTKIGVALDALSVFVNKDNPLQELSLSQIDGIFSATYKSGVDNIFQWSQLLSGQNWQDSPIRMYGRNSASGTYGYFKSVALFGGDYKNTVKERPGSAAVVQSVSEDKNGIGYSGVGYLTSNVIALPISKNKGDTAYVPSYKNVLSGKYPLARLLYVYLLKDPTKGLDPLVTEFIKFILSAEGQKIVAKDGYLPLTAAIAEKQLQLLQ